MHAGKCYAGDLNYKCFTRVVVFYFFFINNRNLEIVLHARRLLWCKQINI